MARLISHGQIGTWKYEQELVLQKIFDFSTDSSFGDYTYKKREGNGLVIHNGYCDGGGSSYGDGTVYKTVNATKYWSRIKFWLKNTSYGTNQGGGVTSAPGDTAVVAGTISGGCSATGGSIKLRINDKNQNIYEKNVSLTLGNQYYLDTKFKDGVFEVILLDSSLNVVDSLSQDLGVSTLPYSGFSGWEHSATPGFFRIYEYREAYL